MNYKNNLELSIYLRSFGIFDTNIISAIEEIPIEFFKTENINKNVSLKQKFKNKFDKQFNDAYLAAVIAQKFQLKSNEKILEIGTGSGYLTAIFSRLSRKVYTIEKFKTLYVLANNNFKKLKLTNIKSKCEDGFNGWEEESPFDKIFISFVVNQINDNLIKQINLMVNLFLQNCHHLEFKFYNYLKLIKINHCLRLKIFVKLILILLKHYNI